MNENGDSPHSKRLLWAGFMAILAAGVGFSIRGGILSDWGTQFGFTQSDLGNITGGGLTGFGVIILLGALIADKIGYGKLMIFAFLMHFLSAVLTLAATPIYNSMHATNPAGAKDAAYQCLFWGMFLFAIGNGTCEAVVNPLVATLFPKNRTHYLNILHAGWPAGLVAGGLASFFLVGKVRWEIQMSLFLVPVLLYGLMCIGQRFPKSEASVAGVSFGQMLAEFAAPLLLLLLLIHALLGYVELGTDSWISNITGNILASREKGLLLFVYTSSLMFALRFFAGPIVERISPLGLLFVGATCGAIGLTFLGNATTGLFVVIAATIYGVGKTFLWPTMLAVASERFPRGGAITIGAMGGIGMLSAGLLGGPGIGYNQDYFASNDLKDKAPAVYDQYKSPTKNRFLVFPEIQGLDGTKVGEVRNKTPEQRSPAETQVHDADLHGGRMALKMTAGVPATMAFLYLCIIIYFKARGGYKQVHLVGEEMTGGVEAPVQG
ncbi:MAG TPA: MFS transporter [Verrucomicrobiae bacterium]|nr:MFS transporter [Verrucomicrobiae bacterium]